MGLNNDAFLVFAILAIVAVVATAAMKYFVDARKVSKDSEGGNAYRELAEKYAATQTASAASLASIQADFADLKTRLVAIEKVLRQVE